MSDTKRLRRRYRNERYLVAAGLLSILMALTFLLVLMLAVASDGIKGLQHSVVTLTVDLSDETLHLARFAEAYQPLIKRALRQRFPDAKTRADKKSLYKLLGFAAVLKVSEFVAEHPHKIGQKVTLEVPLAGSADLYIKGDLDASLAEADRKLTDRQIAWLNSWRDQGEVRTVFNWHFFVSGDSRDAELAGIGGALVGSVFVMLITFFLAVPVGVMAALYLEEFAPRNRWFDLIEISINNLAAVPSIVFGLLGLSVFINFFDMPRASPLVGGIVLSLMTLPTMVIASRASLKSVPISVREAALAIGASKTQTVFHHVLPGAVPGILTGAIIGMAQALGETAPLLMIGMVSFITEIPTGITDAATVLPVQIFLWADSPERSFVSRTAAGIIVLLVFLLAMNATSIILRRRLEIRW